MALTKSQRRIAMTTEEMQMQRLCTIARMAATLEAGDRAALGQGANRGQSLEMPWDYASRAAAIFDAVERFEQEPRI